MLTFKVKGINYEKGEVTFKQGIKGGYIPRNAVAGSNGSFLLATQKSKLNLSVEDEKGKVTTHDVISHVKSANGWTNMSDKRAAQVEEMLKKTGKIEISEDLFSKIAKEAAKPDSYCELMKKDMSKSKAAIEAARNSEKELSKKIHEICTFSDVLKYDSLTSQIFKVK